MGTPINAPVHHVLCTCPLCAGWVARQLERQRTKRIAELNDLARTAMGVASRVIQTSGINALPAAHQSAIRELVERFDDFSEDNNPHGERDFGSFVYNPNADICEKIFWKIDYFDKSLEYGSDDPADPAQTTRVLTIMLASEY